MHIYFEQDLLTAHEANCESKIRLEAPFQKLSRTLTLGPVDDSEFKEFDCSKRPANKTTASWGSELAKFDAPESIASLETTVETVKIGTERKDWL